MSLDRKKVTKDLFPYIFEEAVAFYQNKRTKTLTQKNLVKYGMNSATALRLIDSISKMLCGEVYKSTISISATDYYLRKIYERYGREKLSNALFALKKHLIYYGGLKNKTPNSKKGLWSIHSKYINLIKGNFETKDEMEQNDIERIIANEDIGKIIEELNNIKTTDPITVIINTVTYKRDNKTISQLKHLRDYRCQMCGVQIPKSDGGFYIEGAHIDPKRDKGNELPNNIMILCPNHHKEFDFGKPETLIRNEDFFKFNLNGNQYDISLKIEYIK